MAAPDFRLLFEGTAKDLSREECRVLSEQAEAVVAKGPHATTSVVWQLHASMR